jgi:chromosome segregation ATPase
MRNPNTLTLLTIVILAGLAPQLAGVARAQEARGGGGAVSAQLAAQLQQLSAERAALQAENAQLKQQLAAARKERDALKKEAQSSALRMKSGQAVLARSSAQAVADQQKIAQLQTGVQQLIAKFRELVATLRKTEIEEAAAKQSLAVREQDLSVCVQRNQTLYKLDDDVLTHFEKQGFLGRLASDEPFTRIERVRLENYADETRGKAQEGRYPPPSGALAPK